MTDVPHDCAHEDAPGLYQCSVFPDWHHCRECEKVWWLIDGTYFDPLEWPGEIDEVLSRSTT
jgi:hypothetical protein